MHSPLYSPSESGGPPAGQPDEPLHRNLANLQPIFELDQIAGKVLEEMGLGTVSASTDIDRKPAHVDFSVLHFVILPQKSAWLDFMLEADRASALMLYEAFSGVSEASDDDLEDVLRETMNMIHGSLKIAFKSCGVDVIIPLVPQSVRSTRLQGTSGGYSLHSCHVLAIGEIKLRLTMVARVAPITRKRLKNFRLAEVLVEPLAPDGDENLVLVNKGTMLNKRVLDKIMAMAEYEQDESSMHAVVEPSPLASLIKQD